MITLPRLVANTCADLKTELSWINDNALQNFALSLNLPEIETFVNSGTGLSTNTFSADISFESAVQESGFIFIAHAIDFGSGFRPILHQYRGGQGAWLTIRAGLIEMGKVSPGLECEWLRSLSLSNIQGFFDLQAEALQPLAQFILDDLHEISLNLISLGYRSPAEFIYSNIHLHACGLVNLFVENFPLTFGDEYVLKGQKVCFYKKAQLVVSELFMRFKHDIPAFDFPDIDELTAFVDNVVVAMLRRYDIVQCSVQIDEMIATQIPLSKGGEEEIALRSASLTAVERIVKTVREVRGENINSQRLCNWIWGFLGKDGENRSYPRHLVPTTSFY